MITEKNIKSTFLSAILIASFFLFSFYAKGQEIKATAKLDSNAIMIGQQVKLQLSIQYRVDNGKEINIKWPEITDTIRKELEVVEQSKTDTIVSKSDPYLFTQTRTLYLTSFDSGYWAIPPFKFNVSNDTSGIFTEPLLLQVNTVAVDTTLKIKDIKPPYSEEYTIMDWLKDNINIVYGVLIGLLVVLIIIIVLIKVSKIKPPMIFVETPKIPAHITAFEKLDKLKNDKLWQEGKLKQYHSTLTDIVREYIENRFKIPAMEQTTDEILFGFRNVAVDEESKSKLKQILILADLVKFAKELPLPNENEMSLTNAYDFVTGTKKEDVVPEVKQTVVAADSGQ